MSSESIGKLRHPSETIRQRPTASETIPLILNDFHFEFNFSDKNFDYPEKTLKYKHIRRISD